MTYKQIEASRELRLWIGQVIRRYDGGRVGVHSGGQERGFHKAGTAEMETQIQEQGLSRPFAFYFPYAAGRKAC